MQTYELYGTCVALPMELPLVVSSEPPRVFFEEVEVLVAPPADAKRAEIPGQQFGKDHWAEDAARVWLDYPGLGLFLLDWKNGRIQAQRDQDCSDEQWRSTILHQALPVYLAGDGELLVHASGVVIDGRAALFCGPSGSGKSTLAAWFNQHGYELITDDVAALQLEADRVCVRPIADGLRLRKDSAEALYAWSQQEAYKTRFDSQSTAHESVPVGLVVQLRESAGEDVEFQLSSGAEALMILVSNAFRASIVNPSVASEIDRWSAVLERLATGVLRVPRDFELLPRVEQALCDALRPTEG